MEDIEHIKLKIKKLKMKGLMNTFEHRLKQASEERWSYSTLLDVVLADEVDQRTNSQLDRRLYKSFLDREKTLEIFNFAFNPKIPAATLKEFFTCKFIDENQNIFLIGPTGTGKSHLAQAFGHEACRRGIDVLYYRCHKLFDWIHSGRGDGSHKKRLGRIIKVPLLILDDFGLQSLPEIQQEDLYEVICQRYEKKAMIITSNRDIGEWAAVFANPLIGSAAMDRLVHRGVEIVLEGKSYRLDQFQQQHAKRKGIK